MVIDDNRHSGRLHRSFEFNNSNLQPDHKIAHPLDRLAAFVVDVAILFLVSSLAIAPIQKKIKSAQLINENQQIVVGFALVLLIIALISIFYNFFMTYWKSGTLGKLAFGIRVVDVWTGGKPKPSDVLIRAIMWWFDSLLICLPHFGMYSDPLRRPFHDRVANTVVVSVTSRKGHTPEKSEMTLVKSLFVALYCMGFIFVIQQVRNSYSLIGADEHADILSLASPVYCDAVSDAQAQWPLENNEPANRVSIALALFAAGQVEEECLDQEAYLEFQNGERPELAYLARAFATSEESSLSDKYLEKVCEQSQKSEACRLSELISYWTDRSWDKATEGFMASLPSSSVFVKTWAIKHFEKVKDYSQELKVINSLWPLRGLGEFLASHRTVALWGTHKSSEARVSLQSAIELLPKSKQLGLSSWMCFNELESSCSAELPSSCEHFEHLSEDTSTAYSHDLYALTQVRIASCKGFESLQNLKKLINEPKVSKLIEAIENEHNGKLGDAVAGFRDLSENTESTSPIYHEAVKHLLNVSKDEEKEEFLNVILEDWHKAKTPDLWNWMIFGENLISALIDTNHYKDAISIGTEIILKDPENVQVKKQLVVAAFKSKNYPQVAKYLRLLDAVEESERAPASEDIIKKIRRELRSVSKDSP